MGNIDFCGGVDYKNETFKNRAIAHDSLAFHETRMGFLFTLGAMFHALRDFLIKEGL